MTTIAIFGKQGCAKCETTKSKIRHFVMDWHLDHKVQVVFHDMDTVDGRAEGMFHDVLDIPATVVSRAGQSIARWDGVVPQSEAVRSALEVA